MIALTVDDSPTVRHIVAKTLKTFKFEVYEAGNGLEALDLMNKLKDVAIVVLDWNMPEMDGYQFLVEVRKNEEFANTKIMMLTTENQRHYIVKAIMAGANEYLMKPFSPDMLSEKVKMLLDIKEENS
jgi:two-component system, chemotaxis family, chemotaxis protein CheY